VTYLQPLVLISATDWTYIDTSSNV